ncbi:acyl-CoA reductase-like NAD-dependent aldehyde dehydrogenase [Rhodoligotrophos appendicifer]|uniref:aldehyde dehydrogenase family protein n=1 Tax=Rhodoligotrophos appendicifer TaxID=987056 RepID=UPI00118520E2|nr:aldehyde dehydrogenase family protein [Rhodoligotrophos appendicifer]
MSKSFSVGENIANLRSSQPSWAASPLARRIGVIGQLRELIAAKAPQFAAEAAPLLGKSQAEFVASEIIPLADACRFVEKKAEELLRPRPLGREGRPFWLMGSSATVHREPFGLILIIGPSNYPLLLPGVQAIQALAAGNAVLVKPGQGGTLAMQWLGVLLDEAGLPPSLFEITSETVEDAKAALRDHVDKVVLTGSNETGRSILSRLSERVIPAVVELSGSDPVIVLQDADIEMTANALAYGLRLNGSATCIAPRRVIAVGETYAALRDVLLLRRTQITGRPASTAAVVKLTGLLRDARSGGAEIHGDFPVMGQPMIPLIIENVDLASPLARADIFAPVLMLFQAKEIEDAVAMANASPYALGASIFGSEATAITIASRIEAGMVCINDMIVPTADPRASFVGRRGSGFGATRGPDGLLEMTRPKVTFLRKGSFRPHFEPQQADEHEFLLQYLVAAHGRNWTARVIASIKALRYMISRGMRRPHS